MAGPAQLTPMLRHYLEVKNSHPDALLLYRMGDFYEAFFEDAERAAPLLEVALTARHRGKPSETPMCGVPHHALEVYLAKLLRAGQRVAICEQVEDPAEAKGLVKREVTRVVTPGTVSEPDLLDSKEASLLAAVEWTGESGAAGFLDVSTGELFVRRWRETADGVDDLSVLAPREVLVAPGVELPPPLEAAIAKSACRTEVEAERLFGADGAAGLLERQLGTGTLRGFGLEPGEPAIAAAATAVAYARDTQQNDLAHVNRLVVRESKDALLLDPTTLANLEVLRNQRDGGRGGTLLSVLDRTATPAGGRLLKEWLRRPLADRAAIERRHEAVEELVEKAERRAALRERMSRFGDPERLLARAVLGTMTPREAAALRDGLGEAPALLGELGGSRSTRLAGLAAIDPVEELGGELARILEETPGASLEKGGVIASGVDSELDDCRSLDRDSKTHLMELQARERERTGIASLKVRYNKVFGYYIEISKAKQALVPDDYVRKQTLVNAERYITEELKELEEKILAAEARRIVLETRLFDELRRSVVAAGARLSRLAAAVAELDVLADLAEVAAKNRYARPRMRPAGEPIRLSDGRHPVVERLGPETFVPNDTELGGEAGSIVVLTGPNMGGKSTYLRQVALIVLMAQAGSFVPCAEAEIGLVDRIFTRVGASDDLTRGESTFMVEMVETARILHQATLESLVVLDEVGRGTATFDGLSLAWAIVEHLDAHGRPKTLFATHYHELTELASLLPSVVNRTLAVKEWRDRIVFLRRVVPGAADKSYGLHVARLAGIPAPVVERAGEILSNLEAHEYDLAGRPRIARGGGPEAEGPDQMQLFTPPEEIVASIVAEVDLERLSPLAALNLLHSLKSRLEGSPDDDE